MCNILIFGGTTEGRLLAEFCHENQIEAWVSVATEYGKMVLLKSEFLHIKDTPMNEEEMECFIREKGINLAFDATHPYAAKVSENITRACYATETKCLRILRDSLKSSWEGNRVVWVDSVDEAVSFLNKESGNVLVTTGSKELNAYTKLKDWKERIYARILPSALVMAACEQMGLKGKQIIGMQGPFSKELNQAMILQYDIKYLVTKEAGHAGGFLEKLQAAEECKITTVVIGRPLNEKGVNLLNAKEVLLKERPYLSPDQIKAPKYHMQKGEIFLMGIGMGGKEEMSVRVLKTLQTAQVIFGAKRLLEELGDLGSEVKTLPFYLSKDILPWLLEHTEYKKIAILFSGDTGFYSGAKKMAEALKKEPFAENYETEILPGISSVSYLCARLNTSWEDVRLISLHGRTMDLLHELKHNSRVFALLDQSNSVNALCSLLMNNGFFNVRLSVGERLSYPEEKIITGTPKELEGMAFDNLSAVLIER